MGVHRLYDIRSLGGGGGRWVWVGVWGLGVRGETWVTGAGVVET